MNIRSLCAYYDVVILVELFFFFVCFCWNKYLKQIYSSDFPIFICVRIFNSRNDVRSGEQHARLKATVASRLPTWTLILYILVYIYASYDRTWRTKKLIWENQMAPTKPMAAAFASASHAQMRFRFVQKQIWKKKSKQLLHLSLCPFIALHKWA